MGGFLAVTAVPPAPTHAQTSTVTVTAPSTEKHAGLGISAIPGPGGRIKFTLFGKARSATLATDVIVKIRFGTGAAPTLNAAATGTIATIAQTLRELIAAATVNHQFAMHDFVEGLTQGTSYWFDITVITAAGDVVLDNIGLVLEPI